MKTTIDGKRLKRGEHAWEVGFDMSKELFVPTVHIVHKCPDNEKIYYSYGECIKRCDELNESNQ